MKTSTLLLPSIAALAAVALNAYAADFPQWRGPKRDGHSPETGLLKEWPKDGPKLVWQVKDIASGYSTPSIVGDRIYLISNEGMENEFALALSTKDGSRVWSTKLGVVGNPQQDPSYPAARSTPTVEGKVLYALGSDGDLVCLETTTGKEKWRKSLRKDFGGKPGVWAYSESPLIDGDALICTPGGSDATMVALNKNTGATIWKCALPDGGDASYACLIVFESTGTKQYVQFLQQGLIGVEAKTGKLLWRYGRSAKDSPAVIITPLADGDYVYSGAFRAGGALVKPTKKDGEFVAEEIYFNNKLPVGLGGVVKAGDYLYGSSGQGVMCVDFKTGEIKWEERGIGPSSWLVADGRLYLHAERGDVALLEPTPEAYHEKGRFTPPDQPTRLNQMEKAWAYPVIANGRLYIRDQNSLWCYDIKTRK
ncbi:MAG TPA: PQQ-binding-like beta-propeller repeat protein [Verrucomicrobiae bacterium]|nr:PQQ-binding-like beta-propeller repeat protein [Verrucomicrobiae bacterium]